LFVVARSRSRLGAPSSSWLAAFRAWQPPSSSSLAGGNARPLSPPHHGGARNKRSHFSLWLLDGAVSGGQSAAQDHVAWRGQHGEVDPRIRVEDHQIRRCPLSEPGLMAEPCPSTPGTGPERILS